MQRRKRLRKVSEENIESQSTPEIPTDILDSTPETQSDTPSTQPESQPTQTPETTQTQSTESPSTPLPPLKTPTPPTMSPQTVYSPSPLASASPNVAEVQHSLPISRPGHRLKSQGRKFKRMAAPTGVLKVLEKQKEKKSKRSKQRQVEQETDELRELFDDVPEFSDAQVTSTIKSVTSEIEKEFVSTEEEEVLETQGRNEGELVEKEREDERSGLGQGQKESDRPPLDRTIESSRDDTNRVEVESSPLSQSQTPPIHSDSSKQELVSEIHGDMPPPPPSSHLETESVETREDQPHPSPSFQSLESSQPRDTVEVEPQAQLSTDAGTNVEEFTSCEPQGSFGSPTLANTTPAFDVGTSSHVPPETGSTGNLSDPGMVNVSQIDSGCKASESISQTLVSSKENQMEVLRKIQNRKLKFKGKIDEVPSVHSLPPVLYLLMLPFATDFLESSSSSSSSSDSEDSFPTQTQRTATPSQTVSTTTTTQSKDELCQLLTAILLSETNLNVYDRGLLHVLEFRSIGLE